MNVKNEMYLNNVELKEIGKKYKLFIFGAGNDGKKIIKQLEKQLDIVAFVDNNRKGEFIAGYPIIGMDEMAIKMNSNCKIIISTVKYAEEIVLQLEKEGYCPEKDYYIWDDVCLRYCDKEVELFVNFNKKIWQNKDTSEKKNQIIIPYETLHDVSMVVLAYCGQYLAEKYDADIYCYPRRLDKFESEAIWKVYQSFGVKKVLYPMLSGEKELQAEKIAEELWENIYKMEDWNNISIYGISFGTTFIRDYLRFYVPSLNVKDSKMKPWFIDAVKRIVFWYDYINENNVKALIMWDGVHREGYLRDIAITKNIPSYAIHYTNVRKLTLNYTYGKPFAYFKEFWNQLSEQEKKYGLEWSKKHLENRLRGSEEEIPYMRGNSPYAVENIGPVLEKNNKLKILICPHSFEDDSFGPGEQIFDNNRLEWLIHLGELSEKILDYDWYLKQHPMASERDLEIIEMLLEKYPRIKKIRADVSPLQLKEEGIDVALTVAGTIGHEYPILGIPVINAGDNPHMSFDFNWNPKTKEEFDELIYNLRDRKKHINIEEIYQFYCIHYLYYNWDYYTSALYFFKNSELRITRDLFEKTDRNFGVWKYRLFMEEWSEKRHLEIKENVIRMFEWLDNWRPEVFYRREKDE